MPLSIPQFPNSYIEPFQETSPNDTRYNCIAWAFGINHLQLWPNNFPYYTWPPNISNKETIDSFVQLFNLIGYVICHDGNFEPGYDKIAIFAIGNTPKHAAKQIGDNLWSSKLGKAQDVSHTIQAISGGMYGNVAVYMRRQIVFP